METVQKWGFVDRITHLFLLIGVTINIVTGLPLIDENLFGFLLPLWQVDFPFGLKLHIIAAFLLMGAALIHVINRAVLRRKSEIWLTSQDIKDFLLITKHWFGLTKDYPQLGCHHPGQKMVYWAAAILGLITVGSSGIIMWLQTSTLQTIMILLHDVAFVLMTAIVAGHFILALTPTNWPVLKAMFTNGKTPLTWAQHHHPLWAEKLSHHQ